MAMRFSAATALDEVRAGVRLLSITQRRSMEEIIGAVRDAKTGLRLGLASLGEDELRKADADGWSVAMIVGHALAMDEAAHLIARSLALERVPEVELPHDRPGEPNVAKDDLLRLLDAAEARIAEATVLAAGGPTFAHRDLGPLDARGWMLFIGVHDAMHLHQAADIVRAR